MYGVYSSSENVPFIILRTNDFNNTFAGMLQWESSIVEDLSPLFGEMRFEEEGVVLAEDFTDEIINNQDARILRHSNGDTALLYSFPNTTTVIITTDTEAFFEVFKRLRTSQPNTN